MKKLFGALLLLWVLFILKDRYYGSSTLRESVERDSIEVASLIDSVNNSLSRIEETYMEKERLEMIKEDSLDSIAKNEAYENQLLWEENGRLKAETAKASEAKKEVKRIRVMPPIRIPTKRLLKVGDTIKTEGSY